MTREFFPLTVLETIEEIGGQAKTVAFDVPANLADVFAWRAGQHLSFRFSMNGEEVRRSYSISSSPFSGEPLRITVKRVNDGLVSNHINDNVKAGDVIDVMPPFGGFCLDPGNTLRRTHYFFGAGSGVTPLYSMLHSVLCAEPHSVVHLAYGNTNHKGIIFLDQLSDLAERYKGRVTISHVLSNPSMWTTFTPWRTGMIDRDAIGALITQNPPYAQDAQYYICGPGGMNGAVKAALMSLDVPENRIHMESYGGVVEQDMSVTGIAAEADVLIDGVTHKVPIAAGQTVLDAVRSTGLEPPFSCQSGVCGACRAQLITGDVHMRARMALDDAEVGKGAILTCQSVATTPTISLSYD